MKVNVSVCKHCNNKSCDGAMWRIVKIVRISDSKDTTASCHPDNFENCTLRFFGVGPMLRAHTEIDDEVTRDYTNWVDPSRVTLKKISN